LYISPVSGKKTRRQPPGTQGSKEAFGAEGFVDQFVLGEVGVDEVVGNVATHEEDPEASLAFEQLADEFHTIHPGHDHV
jgi:hypothetical protein